MKKLYFLLKRIFDILFALTFFAVLFPIYPLTAVIIMIVSPGNPIYKAERIGKDGRVFTCYKFRSMNIDSGQVRLTTLRNDERIFPFGAFIRRTKVDEFPQILNVLLGQMSVVGPRPEDRINADKLYVGGYERILSVRPGLTSPASLYDYTHGEKYETEAEYERDFLPKKLQLEYYYVKNQSLAYDIVLIIRTAVTIIKILCGVTDFPEPKEFQKIPANTGVEGEIHSSIIS